MASATMWLLWLWFAIGSVGWMFFVLLEAFKVTKDAAAWVQAFGSIAAIVGAFSVAQHTHQLERRTRAEEKTQQEVDALHFAENAAYEAYSAVVEAASLAVTAPYMIGLGRIVAIRYTLRGLGNTLLPTAAFNSILVIQEHVSDAQNAAERAKQTFKIIACCDPDAIQELEYRRDELEKARKIIAGIYWNKATEARISFQRRPGDPEPAEETAAVTH